MNNNQQSRASTDQVTFGHATIERRPPAEAVSQADAADRFESGSTSGDVSYFLRRVSEERTAAWHAQDARVRRVHIELAERYEERVRQATTGHSVLWL